MNVFEVIRLASNLSCVIPLICYILRFNVVDKPIHLIGIFVLSCGVADFITFFHLANTAFIFNLQNITQFFFLAGFFYIVVFDKRKFITWGINFYSAILIADTLFLQGLYTYQTLMWTVSGISLIVFSIVYILHLYQITPPSKEAVIGKLCINCGLLFYFCFSLGLFAAGDYILNHLPTDTKMAYWSCHNVNNVTKNVLIGIGVLYSKKYIE